MSKTDKDENTNTEESSQESTTGSGKAPDGPKQQKPNITKKPETVKVKTQENMDDVKKTPEWKEFVNLCQVTGMLPGNFEDLDLEKQKEFEVGFNQWMKAGQPKPKMPEIPKAAIASPVDIWMVKHKSKTWYYYDDTEGHKHGVKEILGKIVGYTLEWNKSEITDLLEERDNLTPIQQIRSQYIVFDNRVHPIHEEDLLRPFDDVMADVRSGKI